MINRRRVRIGLEVQDKIHFYEDLRIQASGTKYANPLQNECQVIVSGLNAKTRDFILTETSPLNKSRKPRRLIVEAGREQTGLFQIFVGDIVSAEVGSPPDVDLTIKAKTNNRNNGTIVAWTGEPLMRLSEIAQRVATDCGVSLKFEATDKNIANYSFSGAASRQVMQLQRAGNVRAYVDDGTLFVRDQDSPVKGRRRIINENSGMVGIPKATEKGLEVTYLIDGESDLGGQLTVESKMNPSLSGDYVVNRLDFEIATHEDPFFYTALCSRKK